MPQVIAVASKIKAQGINNRHTSNRHFLLSKIYKTLKINSRIKSQPLILPHLIVSLFKMIQMLNTRIILNKISNLLNKYLKIINCKK